MKKEPLLTLDLAKKEMCFELKDGSKLLIHEDDIKSIARQIRIDILMDYNNPNIILRRDVDKNLERVKKIQEILSSDPKMADDIKNGYHKLMQDLLSKEGETDYEDKKFFNLDK